MKVSRRTFLKETFLGVACLSAARFIPTGVLFAAELNGVPEKLFYFSPKEYLIFQAAAERLVGFSSREASEPGRIDVAARADKFLSEADPEVQDQFHQLLTIFNAPLFTFLFDFRFSSFLSMSPEDKDSYLEDWMTSILGVRRTGFQALKRTAMSMFYTEARSWNEIGYDGMFMPEDRR